jgi:DHA1 family bicyclomycin/chloramphenicol resistance-like MFS transporter
VTVADVVTDLDTPTNVPPAKVPTADVNTEDINATGSGPPVEGTELSGREQAKLIVILGLLVAIAPLTIDMYLPSLPSIALDLGATATAVQLTLAGTLVGLAVGQLFIGPISDAVGRRTPIVIGLGVHILASLLILFAPNVAVLGALRVVQGLGTAAAAVVASAVVRDKFSGPMAAVVFSRLMLVIGVAPILAPTLGSQVLRLTAWQGVFGALAVLGVAILLLAVFALPETLPRELRRTGGLRGTVSDYGTLLRDRTFIGLVLVAGLAMASIFAYVAGSSFVYQEQYGLDTQQFGLLFGAGAAGLIAASQLNVRLLNRYSPQQILVVGLSVGSVGAAALVVFAATGFGGLPALVGALLAVLAAGGIALPNAPALALTRHGEAAGTASAMVGAAQFGIGAVAAPLVGVLGTDALAMAAVVASGMILALVILLLSTRSPRPAPIEAEAPAAA